MGIPGLPKDIGGQIQEFLSLLRDMNQKLDVLIEQGKQDNE